MTPHDPTDILDTDREQEAADRAIRAEQVEVEDLKWVLSDKRGRRFVARMLDQTGIWRLSFSTNALTMGFHEGARNLGLRLLADLTKHCPGRYLDMIKEALNDRSS